MMGFNQYSIVSTWGEFFCAHTHMLIEMFLDEKAKLNDVKLLGLSWAHTMWSVCTLKCTWKNRYMPKAGLIQYVVLWFVTAEDSWNMNRKNAHNIFTSHIFPTNTRLLGCIYHLLRECLDVFFTHLFLHGKWNGSHLLTQTSSIICCFDLYCFPNVTYSLQLRYLLWNQKASNNSPQKQSAA